MATIEGRVFVLDSSSSALTVDIDGVWLNTGYGKRTTLNNGAVITWSIIPNYGGGDYKITSGIVTKLDTGATMPITIADDGLSASVIYDETNFPTGNYGFTGNSKLSSYAVNVAKVVEPDPDPEPEPEPVILTLDGSTISNTLNMRKTKLYVDDVLAVDGTKIKVGSIVKGIPLAGYKLVSFNWVDFYGDVEIQGTVKPDGSSAEFTARIVSHNTEFNVIEPITVEGIIEPEPDPEPDPDPEPEPVITYKVTPDFMDLCRVNGITATADGSILSVGSNIPTGSELVLTLKMGGFYYVSWGFDLVTGMSRDFTLSSDKKTATLSPFPPDMDGEPTISAYGVEPTPTPDDSELSLLSSFALKETDIPKLADVRNAIFNDGAGGDIDFTKYFIGLYRLPFAIPSELLENEKQVVVGFHKSSIIADYFIKNLFTYDMGEIEIPLTKNNSLDFTDTICILHLPYADSINIESQYIIGEKIHVYYDVNVYTGNAVINVFSYKVNSVIYTKEINLGLEIPYASRKESENITVNQQIGLGNNNGILTPFVEVMRNDAVLENGFFTIPVPDESLLINQSGFIKIEEINLNCKASKDEKEMILNAINQGVIIK